MRTGTKWAAIAALVAAVGVPTAAVAATEEPAPDTTTTTEQPYGPPEWVPEECQEYVNSPEAEAWRAEHQAEMQATREERQAERQELREQRAGAAGYGMGHGPGRMHGAPDAS